MSPGGEKLQVDVGSGRSLKPNGGCGGGGVMVVVVVV